MSDWETGTSADGRTYYVNIKTHVRQWDCPPELRMQQIRSASLSASAPVFPDVSIPGLTKGGKQTKKTKADRGLSEAFVLSSSADATAVTKTSESSRSRKAKKSDNLSDSGRGTGQSKDTKRVHRRQKSEVGLVASLAETESKPSKHKLRARTRSDLGTVPNLGFGVTGASSGGFSLHGSDNMRVRKSKSRSKLSGLFGRKHDGDSSSSEENDVGSDSLSLEVIQFACHIIEQKGLDEEGLYRISGSQSAVREVRESFRAGAAGMSSNVDIHDLTGALKLYLRELDPPLIPFKVFELLRAATTSSEIGEAIESLLELNRQCLEVLVTHISRVVAHSDKNKMTLSNLGIVFGAAFLRSCTATADPALLATEQSEKVEILRMLVEYAETRGTATAEGIEHFAPGLPKAKPKAAATSVQAELIRIIQQKDQRIAELQAEVKKLRAELQEHNPKADLRLQDDPT